MDTNQLEQDRLRREELERLERAEQRHEQEMRERQEQRRIEEAQLNRQLRGQEQRDQEREGQVEPPRKRRAPSHPVMPPPAVATQAVTLVGRAGDRMARGAKVDDGATVAEAATQGFSGGFADGLSAVSGLGTLARIVDELESSEVEQAAQKAEHFERFPELRDVEMLKGTAARFPELAEQPLAAAVQHPSQDEGLDR